MKEQATFAGGCFWCLQGPFDVMPGVSNVQVGYTGGSKQDAVYDTVASGRTDHREGIHMEFDPTAVPYEKLVETFLKNIDPTDAGGQFADRGHQYTTAIYYHTAAQKAAAEAALQKLGESGKFQDPIAVQVVPFTTFFPAEDEHQSYYKKRPLQYNMYKRGSGRADFIKNNWEA